MIQSRNDSGEIQLPRGFSFSSLAAGIKASGRPDLALIGCVPGTKAAAVFTRNRVIAAPLQVAKESLRSARGSVRAVIVNSGNANCATGEAGLRGCRRVCAETAKRLAVRVEEVFPSSTGIIGVPFPDKKITSKLAELISCQRPDVGALQDFSRTIMTTDTRPKIASAKFRVRDRDVSVLGVAKGSGMIHPQLATMLVYVMTDLAASPAQLSPVLKQTCEQTFNCISVDGDTSTNDTVLLLASGQSGVRPTQPGASKGFQSALMDVCHSLAEQIVADGEGVKHVIELTIEQARSEAEAKQIAKSISHSLLVKTAWAGADPNWGRILAAVGYSGVPVDPGRISIFVGGQKVCHRGQAYPFDEQAAHQHLSGPRCQVRVELGRGRHRTRFYSTDLTAEYVQINADYST